MCLHFNVAFLYQFVLIIIGPLAIYYVSGNKSWFHGEGSGALILGTAGVGNYILISVRPKHSFFLGNLSSFYKYLTILEI
jgi:hypothetical protein